MNKIFHVLISTVVGLGLLLSACQAQPTPAPTGIPPTPVPTAAVEEEPQPTAAPTEPLEDVLYVNLMWHQHQPLYYKNEDGIYTRPWVRAHATKDYYDMAYLVSQYPDVHVTFNLTPVLLRQIEDFVENDARDLYWHLAEIPAAELSEQDRRFILERFFDVNWDNIIARFPGYQRLLDLRGGSDTAAIDAALETFSEQDFRDLQVWFNLAWFDPMFLEQEPLAGLVDKDRSFSEADKAILFTEVERVMADIVPLHRQMQEDGQIEVTTTPYAHPILPLIIDTNLAAIGAPEAELPQRFSYPADANVHLERSVELYEQNFGRAPRGLWPGEGSVSQTIVPFVLNAGYTWMASGEQVLAKSLGIDSFTRDSTELVNQADQLYRPYYVTNQAGDQLAVFFRDHNLSDKIGFTYSGTPGSAAAADLVGRLENIRTRLQDDGAEGPHIVSIILDGENAWEYYQNDGIEFLASLYQRLSDSDVLRTITPSEYLEMFPEQRSIEELWAGAWFQPNYDTWIGEAEENLGWDYLRQTRELLAKYNVQRVRQAPDDALAAAEDFMLLAQGSDWFWWYGTDQDSGQDQYFDIGFRALLRGVYESLGEEVPTFVDVPIIQARPVTAAAPLQGLSSPVVDGSAGAEEWAQAATYPEETPGAIAGFAYAIDEKSLFLRVDAASGGAMAQPLPQPVGFYLNAPRASGQYPFSQGETQALLGIAASHAFLWNGGSTLQVYTASADGWTEGEPVGRAAGGAGALEASIPLEVFGELDTGDEMRLVVTAGPEADIFPSAGPAQVVMPDLGLATILFEVEDPENDDHGPGTYTYPTDSVFQSKAFDLKSFRVAYDDNNIIFRIGFFGPIPNPWGSPNGLSIQTLDVYVDQDPGAGSGARMLLPGRNAALEEGNGWEVAIWAEGWTPQVLAPDAETLEPIQITEAQMKILVDPASRTVVLRVPRSVFGEGDPAQWGYAVAVLGQEGYPSEGVWRVRDVDERSAQWRFGGAPADRNHTRIIDLILPEGSSPAQEETLSGYAGSSAPIGELTPDDFPQVPLVLP